MRSTVLSLLVQALSAAAWLQPSGTIDVNAEPPQPQPTICGDIVNANLYEGQLWYYASDVISCLTSVEFIPAVANRFLTYYSQNTLFQTTLSYAKDPPAGYQQPPVDFAAGLQQIQDNVNNGVYKNQYTFEADLQSLVNAVHDGHFSLYAGVLNQFTFGSPYDIVSVSRDGKETPKIYLSQDLQACNGQADCDPMPIKSINRMPVVEYLTDFAKNQSFGMLEPHADWNNLMWSPALDIIGSVSIFGGAASIYPGDELDFEYENGTVLSTYWLSLYSSPGYTGPLETGGDFYNFFVLSLLPASYNYTSYIDSITPPNSNNSDTSDAPTIYAGGEQGESLTSWNSVSKAYPSNTLTYQRDLGLYKPGIITSYLLADIDTAVLSIPDFDEYGNGIATFSSAVVNFARAASNASHVVIDLQQNYGGQIGLAIDTFRIFFPDLVPYTGSRMRAQSYANALGITFNDAFDNSALNSSAYDNLVSSEWVILDRINQQTGQNFTSWAQYYASLPEHGDFFTLIQQYNLTSQIFNSWNLGINFPPDSFEPAKQKPGPWQPENIVILTDGLCSSACSLFVEMMTQVGVKTVAVGGRPEAGPMQAAAGTRGAASYDSDMLDDDIDQAVSMNASAQSQLPLRGNQTDTGMWVTYLGFNLRDQIRPNATTPNQFLYLPASCRIYWTFANWFNYEQLWRDASNAVFRDPSLCVPGSVNASTSTGNTSTSTEENNSAAAKKLAANERLSDAILHALGNPPNETSPDVGVPDTTVAGFAANNMVDCSNRIMGRADQSLCPGSTCVVVETPCQACSTDYEGNPLCQQSVDRRNLCLNDCVTTSKHGSCGSGTLCFATRKQSTSLQSGQYLRNPGGLAPDSSVTGQCVPTTPVENPTCASLQQKRAANPFDPAVPVSSRG